MDRYFRIIYGREYYTWVDGSFQIVTENIEGEKCQRHLFEVDDDQWESFNFGEARCPDTTSNIYISGQWSTN